MTVSSWAAIMSFVVVFPEQLLYCQVKLYTDVSQQTLHSASDKGAS